MKIKTNPVQILVIISLAALLILDGIIPARASSGYDITSWGATSYNNDIPSNLTDIVAIDAGHNYTIALKNDGTVVGWGNNWYGQISIPSGLRDVVAIAAGNTHSLALKSDGTVVGWGNNYYGQTDIPSGLSGVVAIAAGSVHSLALKSDGTVVGWGYNNGGALDIPPDLSDVVAIVASDVHSVALKSDGTIVGWGIGFDAYDTPPPGLTDVVAIDAGAGYNIALKRDGTVVAWGNNNFGQSDVPAGLTDVVAIAASLYHNVALKSDGTIVAWGDNRYGQSNVPAGLTGAVAIAAGTIHSLALVPSNAAPTANLGGPYLGGVNTSIAFDGSGSADPDSDPLTYAWDFGDGGTGTGTTPTHSYPAAGIYNVCLTVSDGSFDSVQACTLAVVYDPSAGFVTGGGWLDSSAGAYKADESLTGKATFGFISKYQKGASVPTGNTAFAFDLAGLSFSSQSYEWLVVNRTGTNAQFKGRGLINGAADPNGNAYKFMLWAGDGSPDTFRIRIWWEDVTGEHDVYDNGVEQPIGAGNIVVHTGK